MSANRDLTEDGLKHAECYSPLFKLLAEQHDVLVTISEMDEIISASNKVQENLSKLRADADWEERRPILINQTT